MPLKIAIIPARSGSKGLPNKNVLMLMDKPLMAYSIEAALKSEVFDKIIVTTDSLEYKMIAEQYGAEVVLRSELLASDTATSFMVIEDVLSKFPGYDYFVLLQPTSPFRNEIHIQQAIEQFESSRDARFLVSVAESSKNSDLIKPIDSSLSLKNFDLDFSNYRRQNNKEYSPNGAIYIGLTDAYLQKKHFFGSDSIAYVMNKVDSIDIDDRIDFDLAVSIQANKNKNKILLDNIEKRIREKLKLFSEVRSVSLVGHSIFDFWDIELLNNKSINNLGIAGITTEQYYRLILDKGLMIDVGDIVFLLLGSNDIILDTWCDSLTIGWTQKIIENLYSLNPGVTVYLIEIPPVLGRVDRSNEVIRNLNLALQEHVEQYDYAHWISLPPDFYDPFGNLARKYTSDGLHFTRVAYEKLAQVLSDTLT